jgi:hypothetical protein
MATFSQQFLANLGRPAMTQGMFDLGAAIGGLPAQARAKQVEEERKKAFAAATPLERYNIAIAQAVKANDLDAAANLTAKRDKFVADQQVTTDANISRIVASQMISSGASEVPESINYGGQQVTIPSRLKSSILEEANELQTSIDARETAIKSATLTDDYADYIANNPQLLERNPMLAKTLKKVTDPASGVLRTERINGVKALIKAVDDDRAARREARYGDAANEVRVQQLVDQIEARGSKTWVWQGNDMADALGDMSDSERNTFLKQAALAIKQNPDATDSEIIDYGMSGMRKMIPGQEQSEDITENEERLADQREANIKQVMAVRDVSREEAIRIINEIRAEANRRNRLNSFN